MGLESVCTQAGSISWESNMLTLEQERRALAPRPPLAPEAVSVDCAQTAFLGF